VTRDQRLWVATLASMSVVMLGFVITGDHVHTIGGAFTAGVIANCAGDLLATIIKLDR